MKTNAYMICAVLALGTAGHASAQQYYLAALKIVPGEPSVMSNLGLSYALSRHLKEAESVLRNASMNPNADKIGRAHV